VAELRHELAELMAGIRLRQRCRGFGNVVSREHRDPFGPFEPVGIDAELLRERPVDADQLRCEDGRRKAALEKAFRQVCEGVVEKNGHGALLASHEPAIRRALLSTSLGRKVFDASPDAATVGFDCTNQSSSFLAHESFDLLGSCRRSRSTPYKAANC